MSPVIEHWKGFFIVALICIFLMVGGVEYLYHVPVLASCMLLCVCGGEKKYIQIFCSVFNQVIFLKLSCMNPMYILNINPSVQSSSVQSLSCVQLFATAWTAARQASLSTTNSQSLLKVMSIELVLPSNYLILCCPLLLLPSIFQSIICEYLLLLSGWVFHFVDSFFSHAKTS